MEGENTVILQVEPNIKGGHLNGQTYTAFVEFVRNQCGAKFSKAVSDGRVEFSVYDAKVHYSSKNVANPLFRAHVMVRTPCTH